MKLRVNAATDALAVVLERIAWLTFAIHTLNRTTHTPVVTPRDSVLKTESRGGRGRPTPTRLLPPRDVSWTMAAERCLLARLAVAAVA